MHQDRPLPVLLADHGHPVASSVDRQVARHTQGFQQGDTVAGDIERSRTVHFTHHRHLVVQELYRHDRVFDQVSLYQALLDHFRQLHTRQSRHMQLAEDREIDIPITVHQIA